MNMRYHQATSTHLKLFNTAKYHQASLALLSRFSSLVKHIHTPFDATLYLRTSSITMSTSPKASSTSAAVPRTSTQEPAPPYAASDVSSIKSTSSTTKKHLIEAFNRKRTFDSSPSSRTVERTLTRVVSSVKTSRTSQKAPRDHQKESEAKATAAEARATYFSTL
jgi:primase-polymerase (primpol)-like protein